MKNTIRFAVLGLLAQRLLFIPARKESSGIVPTTDVNKPHTRCAFT